MGEKLRSQKGFVAVTLITVLAIALVLVVYATLLGTFEGGKVTVGGVGGAEIKYSFNNDNDTGPWTTTLEPSSVSTAWYARMNITSSTYTGPVTVDWQLQRENATDTWTDVSGATETTSITLNGTVGEIIYASSDGIFATGNHNWGADVTVAGTYRVKAVINS